MNGLATLTAKNPPNLGFADAEPLGNRTLRLLQGSYFGNLSVSQFDIRGLLASHGLNHAIARTILIAGMIASPRLYERLSAAWTCLWLRTPVSPVLLAGAVVRGVLASVGKFQVIKAIIGFVLVVVVYQFGFEQRPTQVLAHHEPVLSNIADIAFFERVRMVGHEQVDITIIRNESATFPSRITSALLAVATHVAYIAASLETEKCGPTRSKLSAASAFAFHDDILADAQDGGNA